MISHVDAHMQPYDAVWVFCPFEELNQSKDIMFFYFAHFKCSKENFVCVCVCVCVCVFLINKESSNKKNFRPIFPMDSVKQQLNRTFHFCYRYLRYLIILCQCSSVILEEFSFGQTCG